MVDGLIAFVHEQGLPIGEPLPLNQTTLPNDHFGLLLKLEANY